MSYLAAVYNREREPKTNYPPKLVEYLIKRFHLKKGDKILELGVGNGDLLEEFNKKGYKCYGADKEISSQIKNGMHIKKVDLSKNKFPFPNNDFDVVYHKSFLEHFYRKEADLILSETKRVLKKGGKLIMLVPEWDSQMQIFFEDYTQVHPYDVQAMRDLLEIYEFNNISSEKFYQLPQNWKFPVLKYVSQLLSFFMTTRFARFLTEITSCKFFRWSKELMVLSYGEK